MSRALLLAILALLLGSVLMHLMSQNPGYVLISVGGITVEFSFWFGVSLLVLISLFLWLFLRLLRFTRNSLAGTFSWLKESRDKRAERRTASGWMHFLDGNWVAAKKDLLSAAKDLDKPLVHYLAAAKSAHRLGYREESQFLLEQAEKYSPAKEFSVLMSRARLEYEEGQFDNCLQILNQLAPAHQAEAAAIDLRRQAYIQQRNWPSLLALLPEIKKSGLLSEEALSQLEENVHLSLFEQESLGDNSLQKIQSLWQGLPKSQKKNPKILGYYCTLLHQRHQDPEVEVLLRKALTHTWHAGLVELYGNLDGADPETQLREAQPWVQHHEKDAELLFALGKICIRNALWGQAKSYFEQSLQERERVEVYQALGALMARLGEKETSAELYKKGLALAVFDR